MPQKVEIDVNLAIAQLKKGKQLKAIASELGVNVVTVRARLKSVGFQLRVSNRLDETLLPQIADKYQQGATQEELGQKYSVDAETIRRHLRNYGTPIRPRGQPHGKHLPSDGRVVDKSGYILIKVPPGSHPYANKKGYVREHRLVMERSLGRFLEPQEVVHHLNGVKDDNRPENLELYSSHSKHFSEELVGNHHGKKGWHPGDGAKTGRKKFWTEESVLESIRVFAQGRDRPISRTQFRPPHLPSYTVVNRLFGHWSKAVWLAVGYDPLENYQLASSPQERGICDEQSPQTIAHH